MASRSARGRRQEPANPKASRSYRLRALPCPHPRHVQGRHFTLVGRSCTLELTSSRGSATRRDRPARERTRPALSAILLSCDPWPTASARRRDVVTAPERPATGFSWRWRSAMTIAVWRPPTGVSARQRPDDSSHAFVNTAGCDPPATRACWREAARASHEGAPPGADRLRAHRRCRSGRSRCQPLDGRHRLAGDGRACPELPVA